MLYQLNTKKLFWIWFSNNPKKALNQENIDRLRVLTKKNPKATISFIYAKSLLTEQAVEELQAFCKKWVITPFSMEEDIIPSCETIEEKNLIVIYQREIAALGKEGGNLAAASDIVRWLKPVYSKGIYCEPDTSISARALPEYVTVEAPILLNIGSVKFPISGLSKPSDLELLSLNTDILAIVGDDEETNKLVRKVQRSLYDAYDGTGVYCKLNTQFCVDLAQYMSRQVGVLSAFTTVQNFLAGNLEVQCADQLFDGLGIEGANPITLRKKLLEDMRLGAPAFSRRQLEIVAKGRTIGANDDEVKDAYLKYLTALYRRPAQEKDIEVEAQLQNHKLFLATVRDASGPANVLLTLFEHAALPANEVDRKIMPYAFGHYDLLAEAFSSKNGVSTPHVSREDYLSIVATQKVGVSNDQSWTELGASATIQREQQKAAVAMQRLFRACKTRSNGQKDEHDPLDTSTHNPGTKG